MSRTPENADRVRAAVNTEQRPTVREPEADLGIPNATASQILTQGLGRKRVVAAFVPWLLLPEQEEHRAAAGGTVSGPKVPPLKGTEASLSCVQCVLCLISSSLNVSILHTVRSGPFWTDLVCVLNH